MVKAAAPTLDLGACEREPIHIPGRIQPHGALVALGPDGRISHASANGGAYLGLPPDKLVGRDLAAALPALPPLPEGVALAVPRPLAIGTWEGPTGACDILFHVHAGRAFLEFESSPAGAAPDLAGFLRDAGLALDAAPDPAGLCQAAAAALRALTGFDRVMAYRFDAAWNGEVVAEARRPDLEPFLGLHYPASDIPRQARELYARNPIRLIADVAYAPVDILPPSSARDPEPLDLGHCALRSVSPVHIQYLKNMGVGASMSVSLLVGGRLWGLLACHHATARHVSFRLREACELLGRLLSLQLGARAGGAEAEYRGRLRAEREALLRALPAEGDFLAALGGFPAATAFAGAGGFAVRSRGRCLGFGQAPGEAEIAALAEWLEARPDSDRVFRTEALPQAYPPARAYGHLASGLLAARIPGVPADFLMWFRPEIVRTVTWAGDPHAPALAAPGDPAAALHPRNSFAQWKEVVAGTSAPWRPAELEAAEALRDALTAMALQRTAEDLAAANRRLAESNAELDAFAHVASHDLKEPLRGIQNYAQFLLEDFGADWGAEARDKLEAMGKLSRRLGDLINDLLHYSRVNRLEYAYAETDLDAVLDDALERLRFRIGETGAEIVRAAPLPSLRCDRVRVGEVFYNLVANALKYTDRPRPRVEIGSEFGRDGIHTFHVADDGIGIDPGQREAVFRIFKRLHGRDRYGGGTGAGLTIARRIVERHGGRIRIESRPGGGAVFAFTLQPDPSELVPHAFRPG